MRTVYCVVTCICNIVLYVILYVICNIVRVVSDIQLSTSALVCICRYNTAAHVVDSRYITVNRHCDTSSKFLHYKEFYTVCLVNFMSCSHVKIRISLK